MLSIAFLACAIWFKTYLSEAITAGQSGDNGFSKMYAAIDKKQDDIFVTVCVNAINIQGCSDDDLKTIFGDDTPNAIWMATGALLETYGNCSGLDAQEPLPDFYFTNRVG